MVYVKPRICPGNEMLKLHWDFEIQTDHLILTREPDREVVNKKREPTK